MGENRWFEVAYFEGLVLDDGGTIGVESGMDLKLGGRFNRTHLAIKQNSLDSNAKYITSSGRIMCSLFIVFGAVLACKREPHLTEMGPFFLPQALKRDFKETK